MSLENTIASLFSIVILDLVLAGDNALVIGLAASRLPSSLQRKAIIWGTFGAVVIRALATLAVAWLLKIPGLLGIGGVILLYIAYQLINKDQTKNTEITTSTHFFSALKTIITADVMMGLDNVLAMAGAAQGNVYLIIIGLLISVPIVMGGSTICSKLVSRFPALMYIGSAVLAFTASNMITSEPLLSTIFHHQPVIKYSFIFALILIIFSGKLLHRKSY